MKKLQWRSGKNFEEKGAHFYLLGEGDGEFEFIFQPGKGHILILDF